MKTPETLAIYTQTCARVFFRAHVRSFYTRYTRPRKTRKEIDKFSRITREKKRDMTIIEKKKRERNFRKREKTEKKKFKNWGRGKKKEEYHRHLRTRLNWECVCVSSFYLSLSLTPVCECVRALVIRARALYTHTHKKKRRMHARTPLSLSPTSGEEEDSRRILVARFLCLRFRFRFSLNRRFSINYITFFFVRLVSRFFFSSISGGKSLPSTRARVREWKYFLFLYFVKLICLKTTAITTLSLSLSFRLSRFFLQSLPLSRSLFFFGSL